jgi:hypothetical protein
MSTLDSGPIAALLSGATGSTAGASGPSVPPALAAAAEEADKMSQLTKVLTQMSDPTIVLQLMATDAQKKLMRQQEILSILRELNGS